MEWKPYYRSELEASGVRGRVEKWLRHAMDAEEPWAIDPGAIVSFPHTAVGYAGPLDAELVAALYRAGIHSVVALGVVHSVSLTAIQVALSEQADSEARERAFDAAKGAFVLPGSSVSTPFGELPLRPAGPRVLRQLRAFPDEATASEFSLDTFFALVRLGADALGVKPIPVLPIYVGMTRHPSDGCFEEADRLASLLECDLGDPRTAVVATGDLIHYGTAYGDAEPFVESPGKHFRRLLEETLVAALQQRRAQRAYELCRDVLKNDQREILPVVARLLGPVGVAELHRYALSDYAQILGTPPPCVVASVLATYREAH